jgi:hypothetical protein
MEKNSNQPDIFSYLDPEKTMAQYNSVQFKISERNPNGSIRWRCCKCSVTFTVLNDAVIREPNNEHTSKKCLAILPVKIACIQEYEKLKFTAKTSDKFQFKPNYDTATERFQKMFDPRDVAEHWVARSTAQSCC